MPDAPNIKETIRQFLAHTQQTQSGATAASYHQALNTFLRFLTSQTQINPARNTLAELSSDIFQQFLAFLQHSYSPETEHAYFRAVIALIDSSAPTSTSTAELEELAHQNRRKKVKHEPEIPYKTIAQIHTFLENIALPEPDPEATIQRERLRVLRDKALIFTITDTGLKASEVIDLRLKDFDSTGSSINYQDMQFPLKETTNQAIQAYLRERASLDQQQTLLPPHLLALFARHDKRASSRILPISRWTVGNIVTDWTRQAVSASSGEAHPLTPSLLRHHFVASTLATTDDLQLTQQLARHKDKGTTRNYLRQRKQTTND